MVSDGTICWYLIEITSARGCSGRLYLVSVWEDGVVYSNNFRIGPIQLW